MKTLTFKKSIRNSFGRATLLVASTLLLLACSDDDDDNPVAVNEEETITTLTVTMEPEDGGETVILESRDLDGDGPDAPVITVSNLAANTTYASSIVLLNETESPAENVTEEIMEEDQDHQFFFTLTGSLIETSYEDMDEDGNPIGLFFTLTTGDAGEGSIAVTLRHQPKKPNDGTLADAGGETDAAQTFNVTVE